MARAVTIGGPGMRAVFELRGPAEAVAAWAGAALPPFPPRLSARTGTAERMLAAVAPDRWLLLAPLAEEAALLAALRPLEAPEPVGIAHVSDTLAFFELAGPDAAEAMALASPLDLHPRAFPPDGATFTEAFGLRAFVSRTGAGVLLGVDASHSDFVAGWLARIAG